MALLGILISTPSNVLQPIETRFNVYMPSMFLGLDPAGTPILTPTQTVGGGIGQLNIMPDGAAVVNVPMGSDVVSIPLHDLQSFVVGGLALRFEPNPFMFPKTATTIETTVTYHSPYVLRKQEKLRHDHLQVKSPRVDVAGDASILESLDAAKLEAVEARAREHELRERLDALEKMKDASTASTQEALETFKVLLQRQQEDKERSLKVAEAEIAALKAQLAVTEAAVAAASTTVQEHVVNEEKLSEKLSAAQVAQANVAAKADALLPECGAIRVELQGMSSSVSQFRADAEDMFASLRAAVHRCATVDEKFRQMTNLEIKVSELAEKYAAERARRKALHNRLVEIQGNVRVFARVRPILDNESGPDPSADANGDWRRHVNDAKEEEIEVDSSSSAWTRVTEVTDDETVSICSKRGHVREFEFDHVFDSDVSQEDVFSEVLPLLTSLLDGYKVCIMAYGQTGSGKTHTMQGDESHPGVIPRALQELFSLVEHHKDHSLYSMQLSVYEIYNNEIFDLMVAPEVANDTKYEVRQTAAGVEILGLTATTVTNMNEVSESMTKAHALRAMRCTNLNAHSSRSHCIVTLHISIKGADGATTPYSKLTLVDLAGSECVGMSGVTGAALQETKHINRSLCALADVMNAMRTQSAHVPFRNSKLTLCLSDCLGGNAKMLIFVTIAPVQRYVVESTHALAFGSSVRQVTTGTAATTAAPAASSGSAVAASPSIDENKKRTLKTPAVSTKDYSQVPSRVDSGSPRKAATASQRRISATGTSGTSTPSRIPKPSAKTGEAPVASPVKGSGTAKDPSVRSILTSSGINAAE